MANNITITNIIQFFIIAIFGFCGVMHIISPWRVCVYTLVLSIANILFMYMLNSYKHKKIKSDIKVTIAEEIIDALSKEIFKLEGGCFNYIIENGEESGDGGLIIPPNKLELIKYIPNLKYEDLSSNMNNIVKQTALKFMDSFMDDLEKRGISFDNLP